MNFSEWFENRGVWPRLTYEEVWNAAIEAAMLAVENADYAGDDYGIAANNNAYESVERLISKIGDEEVIDIPGFESVRDDLADLGK